MTEAGGLLPGIIVTPGTHVMNTEIDLDSVTLDPEPVTTAIAATATTYHIEVNLDHSTGLLATTPHIIEAPALTATIVIHPTTDIPGMPPKITADLAKDLETPLQTSTRPFILFTHCFREV